MKNLLILGAGGHSSVVCDTIFSLHPNINIAILDDKHPFPSVLDNNLQVLGPLSYSLNASTLYQWGSAFVAIGDPKIRLKWIQKLSAFGYSIPFFVHKTAFVSPSAVIGSGSIVMANSVIQSHVVVGTACILNTMSSVDHHCSLGDSIHICPGVHIAGNVDIGSFSWIGIGSSVIEGVNIGSNSFVASGASVTTNILSGIRVGGVPARPLDS